MSRPHLTPLLALLACIALPSYAQESPPDTSLDPLLACRHIAAPTARLTCFDRTSAALAQAPAASPGAPRPASRAMKEALNPQRTFGLSHATIVKREAAAAGIRVKDVAAITARIVRLGRASDGRAILTLDNGQVWAQLVPDGTELYTAAGDSVRISRGWLGSYWLETSSHHGCKVSRVR